MDEEAKAIEIPKNDQPEEVKTSGDKDHDGTEYSSFKNTCLTMALYFGFVVTGFATALIGPTLPDLETLTGSTTDKISYVVTCKSFTNFAGAFLGGVLMEKFNMWFILSCCMFLACPCITIVPYFDSIYWVGTFVATSGFFYGIAICVTNIGIFTIWGKKNGPWVQALHCLFVVGMLFAPLVARPFLSKGVAAVTDIPNITTTEGPKDQNQLEPVEVDLTCPYLIAGIITLVAAVTFTVSMFSTKKSGLKQMVLAIKKQSGQDSNQDQYTENKLLKRRKLQLTVLVFCFVLSFCTAEILYGMFLVTFIVQFVGMQQQKAAFIASVFFFVSISSRATGIFLITKVKPVLLILLGMSLTMISAVLFYLANEHVVLLWAACCLAAWGSATQYPSTLTWVSEYTPVKGYVGTALLVSNTSGYFIGPLSLGLLFKTYGISSFLYVLTASVCLKFIAFLVINLFLKYCWKNDDDCDVEMEEVATKGELLENKPTCNT